MVGVDCVEVVEKATSKDVISGVCGCSVEEKRNEEPTGVEQGASSICARRKCPCLEL